MSFNSRTLVEVKYQTHTADGWEGEAKDPLPGMAESLGFIRGVFS